MLEGINYVPTLAVRSSEMMALEYLSAATKRLMVPCFLLAPWGVSLRLANTIKRIETAFPHGNYFLDIDKDYRFSNEQSACQQELRRLMDPTDAFKNWVNFVAQYERVWPCLQLRDQGEDLIRRQIAQIQELGRPFALRVFRGRDPGKITDVVAALNAVGTADYAVILEGGWARDALQLPAWYSGYMSQALRGISAQIPIVVSCTSIPKVFAHMVGKKKVEFTNRGLLAEVRRAANRQNIFYGDWGSTRPREYQDGGAPIPPRIDYSVNNGWWFVRNPDEGWTYQMAAEKLKADSAIWDGSTMQWAEQIISDTAINETLGINSPQKNVAARVNLHLFRQAHFGRPRPSPVEEIDPWEDI